MNMKEINGQKITLPKATGQTITIKDDNGKTKGMVRGVSAFRNCRANLQTEIWRTLREADAELNNVFYTEGRWWYIHNLKWDNDYEKYFKGRDAGMDAKNEKRLATLETLAQDGKIEIVRAYII